jgi:tetratricopeptide (TPR) repeat protein
MSLQLKSCFFALLVLCWSMPGYAMSVLPDQSQQYWHDKVTRYPELAEPRIMLAWYYFNQAKTNGKLESLQQSCLQLTTALDLQPARNGVRLAISLASYQHDFDLLDQLARYYLSYWRYDSQVMLWRLQAAIAQKQDKAIDTLWDPLKLLPNDLHTLIADADVAGYRQDFNGRIINLKQALKLVTNKRVQAWLWLQMAAIYLDQHQDLTQADHALRQAETLNPDDADIQRHRIEWLILNRQYAKARVKLTQLSDWHKHPELQHFTAMIDNRKVYTGLPHSQPRGTICHQELSQFLLKGRVLNRDKFQQIKL